MMLPIQYTSAQPQNNTNELFFSEDHQMVSILEFQVHPSTIISDIALCFQCSYLALTHGWKFTFDLGYTVLSWQVELVCITRERAWLGIKRFTLSFLGDFGPTILSQLNHLHRVVLERKMEDVGLSMPPCTLEGNVRSKLNQYI